MIKVKNNEGNFSEHAGSMAITENGTLTILDGSTITMAYGYGMWITAEVLPTEE